MIKALRAVAVLLAAVAFLTIPVYSQSNLPGPDTSCFCSVEGLCSASQTCPDGYFAICNCSATGCTSYCSRLAGAMDLSVESLTKKLQANPAEDLGSVLSKAFKRVVEFVPTSRNFKFDLKPADRERASHWDILQYLAENGDLKINGRDINFWLGVRRNMANGGEINLCTGPVAVRLIVDELSFLSGKHYSIVSGDTETKINGPFKGTMGEMLANISSQSATRIAAEER